MRVATYYNNRDIRIEERPIPTPGERELLVRIRAAGICGSDVMEWYRVGKGPRVLGHEISGEIVEVGADLQGYRKGDRIALSHHVPCYDCHYCRLGHHTLCDTLRRTNIDPGGFSELARLPEINVRHGVYRLPENVSYEEATLIEPLACALRGQARAETRAPQTVLVVGCGVSGLLHILAARVRGVPRVVASELVDFRREAARQAGADLVLKPSDDLAARLREANEGRLADVVIVCVGANAAHRQAIDLVERGGTILFYAPVPPGETLTVPLNQLFWEQGAVLMSSYGASPEDQREALQLIGTGKVNVRPLITHRLGLSEAAKGFGLVCQAKDSLKVILDPTL